MRTNVEQELIQNSLKTREQITNNEVITEVNRLLTYGGRDTQIMSMIGPQSTAARAQDQAGQVIDLEKNEEYYGGQVFHKKEILTLAKKYRLKFLPSALFIGYIPTEVAADIRILEKQIANSRIRERAKRENVTEKEYIAANPNSVYYTLDESELKRSFFVLAPPEAFELKKEAIGTVTVYKIEYTDPILFYKTADGKFRLVRKWGQDFTAFRWVLGKVFKSNLTFRFWMLVLPITLGILGITLVCATYISTNAYWIGLVAMVFILPNAMWGAKFKSEAFTDGGWCESEKKFDYYLDKEIITIVK